MTTPASPTMNREYHRWHSPNLGREMELLVFGESGARVLVFPARQGRFFDYENWGLVTALRPKIEAGLIQLFCADGIDSETLYCAARPPAERMPAHLRYERYIVDEVVPFTAEKNPHPTLIAHGCSLGGYHAVNIALRHPRAFGRIVALSGRYDLTTPIGHYRDLFDGYRDDLLYFNMPSQFLPRLTDPAQIAALRHLDVVLAVGEDDCIRANNQHLFETLRQKGVRCELRLWDGEAHRPRYWRPMVPHYL